MPLQSMFLSPFQNDSLIKSIRKQELAKQFGDLSAADLLVE